MTQPLKPLLQPLVLFQALFVTIPARLSVYQPPAAISLLYRSLPQRMHPQFPCHTALVTALWCRSLSVSHPQSRLEIKAQPLVVALAFHLPPAPVATRPHLPLPALITQQPHLPLALPL